MDRIYQWMLHPASLVSLIFILGLSYFYVDLPLAHFFYIHNARETFKWMKIVTLLGQWTLPLAICVLMSLHFKFIRPNQLWLKRMMFLLIIILIPDLLGAAIKTLLGRARPDLYFSEGLYGFYGFHTDKLYWSFPSGHAVSITALLTGVYLLTKRYVSWLIAFGLVILATRVVLFQHYLSDVLAGAYLSGLTIAIIYPSFFKRLKIAF